MIDRKSASKETDSTKAVVASGLRLAAKRLSQDLERICLSFLTIRELGALLETARGVKASVASHLAVLSHLRIEFSEGNKTSRFRARALAAIRRQCMNLR